MHGIAEGALMSKGIAGWPWWAKAFVFLFAIAAIGYARVRAVAANSLEALNLFGWTSFDSSFVEWDGDIGATKVRLWPKFGDPDTDAITADRLVIDTPGWGWLLKAAFTGAGQNENLLSAAKRTATKWQSDTDSTLENSPIAKVPAFPRVHATFENLAYPEWAHQIMADSDVIGLNSGGVFEAEGCDQDIYWAEDELSGAIGLANRGINLDFDISLQGAETMLMAVRLDAPGRSSWHYESTYKVAHASNVLAIDWEGMALKSERWTIKDDGFVAARNEYCARRDGLTADAFVERHLQYIQRKLLSFGMLAEPTVLVTYRDFASKGGNTLVWEANPIEATSAAALDGFSAADQLWMLNSHLRVNDAKGVPLKLQFVSAVDYPEESIGTPEQIAAIVASVSATLVDTAPADHAPGASDVATLVPNPQIETMVVDGATAVIGVDGEIPTAEKPLHEDIEFADLQYMIGERVIIKTTMSSTREGTLTAFNRAGVRLQLINRPGMELEIPKDTVASVQAVWTKSQSANAAASAGGK